MSTKAAASQIAVPKWGLLALVTYLPEPLGLFLTSLRTQLATDLRVDDHNPEAHVTFLPPRSLNVPVKQAEMEIGQKLKGVEPFLCELGEVTLFPITNMLYLSVNTGHDTLTRLHKLLNTEGLSADERFEFIPHLTLGGPLDGANAPAMRKVQDAWRDWRFSRSFIIRELVLLWQSDDQLQRDWSRFRTFCLKTS